MAVKTYRKCTRCHGSGYWADRGECFGCNGTGARAHISYTAAERSEQRARTQRTMAAFDLIKATALRHFPQDRHDAMDGAIRLRDTAPERFAKMLDSIDAGRIMAVVAALIDFEQNRD